ETSNAGSEVPRRAGFFPSDSLRSQAPRLHEIIQAPSQISEHAAAASSPARRLHLVAQLDSANTELTTFAPHGRGAFYAEASHFGRLVCLRCDNGRLPRRCRRRYPRRIGRCALILFWIVDFGFWIEMHGK